jgi:pSer/pThr/pTyr-binding forkhead associated (FHA) protein
MSGDARLVLRNDPAKVARLDRSRPLTIGQATTNRLSLPSTSGVAPHHAVVRFSHRHGWIVCDWESGAAGTWLEGERLRQCRPLGDGDEIQLGSEGPVLVFQTSAAAAPRPAPPTAAPVQPPPPRPAPAPAPARAQAHAPLTFTGRQIPLDRIRTAHVRSRPRYPHSFSWWLLLCLGGLVLLPWPLLFWPLQISALTGWILLGSRKDHELIVTLRDGMAHRHGFANRITALGHRNGIRKAIGQGLESR